MRILDEKRVELMDMLMDYRSLSGEQLLMVISDLTEFDEIESSHTVIRGSPDGTDVQAVQIGIQMAHGATRALIATAIEHNTKEKDNAENI